MTVVLCPQHFPVLYLHAVSPLSSRFFLWMRAVSPAFSSTGAVSPQSLSCAMSCLQSAPYLPRTSHNFALSPVGPFLQRSTPFVLLVPLTIVLCPQRPRQRSYNVTPFPPMIMLCPQRPAGSRTGGAMQLEEKTLEKISERMQGIQFSLVYQPWSGCLCSGPLKKIH